jgi:hypothetical protein
MRVGRFKKGSADRKRYVVDYVDWLDVDETVTLVTSAGNNIGDEFYIDGVLINTGGKEVIFYASGGVVGTKYTVTITATTSMGQVKQDTVEIDII